MPGLTLTFQGYISPWGILLLCSLVTVISFSKELSSLHTILLLTWSKPTCIFVYPSTRSNKTLLCFVHPTCLENKLFLYTFITTVSESRSTTLIISKLSCGTWYYVTAGAAISQKQHFWEEYLKPNQTRSILTSFCIVQFSEQHMKGTASQRQEHSMAQGLPLSMGQVSVLLTCPFFKGGC